MAVSNFSFEVVADSRADVIEEMDRISFDILNLIGGAPWLTLDDDTTRVPKHQNMLKSEEDFAYKGIRKVIYQGPMILGAAPGALPPGVERQHTDKDKTDDV